jgi:hypothetical protein
VRGMIGGDRLIDIEHRSSGQSSRQHAAGQLIPRPEYCGDVYGRCWLTQPVVTYNVPLAAIQPALRVIEGGPQSV